MLSERLTADAPGLRIGVGVGSSSGTSTGTSAGAASTSLPVLGAVAAEGALALSRPPVEGLVSAPLTGRVLVIEDDRENRELLSRRLLRQGFEVVTEASGRGGLRRARAESFDLVLLDLIMPGLGGDRVLAEFKSDPVLRELPVIMLSAVDAVDAVVRCILMGAEDYLSKPFNPVLLRARIAACLEKVRLRRQEQATQRALEVERQKSEELLLNILPQPIAARLKSGEVTIVDRLPEVTVLFADLVGFTELASRIDSVEMVRLLDEVFSGFDTLAKSQGLEKIKTIGDAYMVVGGLPTPRPDHAEAIAELALDMLRQVERQSVQLGHSIRLRLGIHTGPVIAGIIGRQKFSYDLWGDTVNTASRMESHGLPGLIQVTDEVHERLRHAYRFEPRGSIAVKGKGAMNTWMLSGRLTP
ncbi:MAG: response regulator [Verrucomicrobiales bacterium]|nr:response regulator [Verrucomicrobiales bacterium]